LVRRDTRTVGFDAERLAQRFLRRNGLRQVAENYRCRLGEIDLIMRDGDCLAFIEVRYRVTNRFASASLSVDSHKQRKIIRTAAMFLTKNTRYANSTVRFDVIAIDLDAHGEQTIDWIRDAFRPTDSSL
jgi:putative endonuclease